MSLSPTCLINGGPTPASVGSGATVTGALATPAGANVFFLRCVSADELTGQAGVDAVNASLSINQTNKTFSYTQPTGLGQCVIFQATVGVSVLSTPGNGLDIDGNVVAAWTTTFKVNVPASNGNTVLAVNEVLEQSSYAGWIANINPALRSVGGAGTGITTLTGDVTAGPGTGSQAATVVKIQHIAVSATTPTAGEYLVQNAAANSWVPVALSGDVAGSTGTPGSIEVTGLLTKALPALAGSPSALVYSGTAWGFSTVASLFTAGGDLGGTATAQEVTGILNHALPSLTTGLLEWNGTAWVFTSASGLFAPGGDLAGSSTSQEVTGILSHALPSLAPGYLLYTGSAWAFGSAGQTLTFQPGGTASANVFTTWAALMTAAASVTGPLTVFFDGSHNGNAATIPSGTYAFTNPDVKFQGPWPLTTAAFLALTVASGATLSGVARFKDLAVASASSASVVSLTSGSNSIQLVNASIAGSSTAAFFSVQNGSTTCVFDLFGFSLLGDGTHAAITTGSGATSTVTMFDAATLTAGVFAGAGTNHVTIASSGVTNNSGVTPTYVSIAGNVGYNDGLVAPTIGQTTVQGAIDYLKSHGGGGGGATLVFQPGGTASGNTFTSWAALYAAAGSITGPLTVFFDCTHNSNVGTIPSGTYAFTQPYVEFVGAEFSGVAVGFPTVTVASGATITGVFTYRQITMVNGGSSPVTTFSTTPGQIVVRLDDALIEGSSTAPYFSNGGSASSCAFILYLTNGAAVGDGIHPGFSATGTGTATLVINQSSLLPANAIAGTNASITMFGPSSINTSGISVDARSSGYSTLIFQPNGTTEGNTFSSWASLFSVANGLNGPVKIFFDGSKNSGAATIPSGTWAFTAPQVTFAGAANPLPNITTTTVTCANGCVISGVYALENLKLTTVSSAAVFSFSSAASFFIRGSNITASASAPLIALSGSAAIAIVIEDFSIIGDGTNAVINSTVSIAIGAQVSLDKSFLSANAFTGTNRSVGVDSTYGGNQTSIATTLNTVAANLGYNDSLVAPAIGVTQVQAAIDYLKSHSGAGGAATLVFQPGGTASGSTFTSWSALFTASAAITGPLTVFFDGSHNGGACTIPSGTYAFTQPLVTFQGNAPITGFFVGSGAVHVTCATGATISGLHRVVGMILDTTSSSAVITYSSGLSSLTVNGSILQSSGSAPFISVTGAAGFDLALDTYSQLGDGTHVALACTSSTQTNIVIINASQVSAGSLSGNIAQSVNSPNAILAAPGFSPSLINVAPAVVIFAPGSTAGNGGYNSFTTWADLYSAVVNVRGPITVFFDSTHSSGACTIPSGTWAFTQPQVKFTGATTGAGAFTTVTCASGCVLSGVTDYYALIMVNGGSSPVTTFSASALLVAEQTLFRGSASAPFFTVTAGTFTPYFRYATLGDGTNAAITRSGSSNIGGFLQEGGVVLANAVGGTFTSSNVSFGMNGGSNQLSGTLAYYGSSNPDVIVFQPGAGLNQQENVFGDWAQVVTAANSGSGPLTVFFDGSHNSNACTIPAGAWSFTRPSVKFTGSITVLGTITCGTGVTISGVTEFENLILSSTSSSPIISIATGAHYNLHFTNAIVNSTTSTPFFSVSGAGTLASFNLYQFSALGDSTHPVVTTGTSAQSLFALLDGSTLTAGSIIGTGNTIQIYSAGATNASGITPVLLALSANVFYNDALHSPALGSTNVQGALDALKALTAGGGSGITQLTGDVVAGPGSGSVVATVEAISGTSPIAITPNVLQWIQGATGPTLTQAQAANASAPVNFTIRPQVPGASATNATNGTGGSLVVDLATPVNGGTKAFLEVTQAGSPVLFAGQHTNTTDSAVYGPVVPAPNNFSWLFSAIATVVNSPSSVGNVEIEIAGSGFANFSAFGGNAVVQFFNSGVPDNGGGSGVFGLGNAFVIPTSAPSNSALLYAHSGALETYASAFQFHRLQASPVITQVQATTDVQAQKLTVQSQAAFSGSTGLHRSTALNLQTGAAASGGTESLFVGDSTGANGVVIQSASLGVEFVSSTNYQFGSTTMSQSGTGAIGVNNASVVPTTAASNGAQIYASSNFLTLFGGSGGGVQLYAGDHTGTLVVSSESVGFQCTAGTYFFGGSVTASSGVNTIRISPTATPPTSPLTTGAEIYVAPGNQLFLFGGSGGGVVLRSGDSTAIVGVESELISIGTSGGNIFLGGGSAITDGGVGVVGLQVAGTIPTTFTNTTAIQLYAESFGGFGLGLSLNASVLNFNSIHSQTVIAQSTPLTNRAGSPMFIGAQSGGPGGSNAGGNITVGSGNGAGGGAPGTWTVTTGDNTTAVATGSTSGILLETNLDSGNPQSALGISTASGVVALIVDDSGSHYAATALAYYPQGTINTHAATVTRLVAFGTITSSGGTVLRDIVLPTGKSIQIAVRTQARVISGSGGVTTGHCYHTTQEGSFTNIGGTPVQVGGGAQFTATYAKADPEFTGVGVLSATFFANTVRVIYTVNTTGTLTDGDLTMWIDGYSN